MRTALVTSIRSFSSPAPVVAGVTAGLADGGPENDEGDAGADLASDEFSAACGPERDEYAA